MKKSKGFLTGLDRKLLLSICVVLVVTLVLLIIILVCFRNRENANRPAPSTDMPVTTQNAAPMKELLLQDVKEQGDVVFVTTSYCSVQYPFAFSDLIRIETETFENYAVMEFSALINGKSVKLYSLVFNQESNIPIGSLLIDGVRCPVSAVIYEKDPNLNDEDAVTFFAAQETFNDVVMSLTDNAGFIEAN